MSSHIVDAKDDGVIFISSPDMYFLLASISIEFSSSYTTDNRVKMRMPILCLSAKLP